MKYLITILIMTLNVAFAEISSETVSSLQGQSFTCKNISVGEKIIPVFLEPSMASKATNGIVTIIDVNLNELIIRVDFDIPQGHIDGRYTITDAKEIGSYIFEGSEANWEDLGDDPFAISIATRVKISRSFSNGRIKKIWLRKGLVNAYNPFGNKDFICEL